MEQEFKLGESVMSKNNEIQMIIVDDKLGEDINGYQIFNGSYECAWYDRNHDVRFEIFSGEDLVKTKEIFRYH